MPYYLNVNIDGLIEADSNADGYSITLKWATAYPQNRSFKIGYNIYMSSDIAPTFPNEFFNQSPSFVSIDGSTKVVIVDLIPGQMYHFGVRAFEYGPSFDPTPLLDAFNGLKILPQGLLRANISATDTTIPLIDVEQFPGTGTIKIGSELIFYSSVDRTNNNLLVSGGTNPSAHFFDFGGGTFYQAASGNVGSGTINNLTLVANSPPTETWTIKCAGVQRNNSNAIIPGTAKFEAIGSISGDIPLGNGQLWNVYSQVVSNGILSFSITETSTFSPGDSFTIKVIGAPIGVSSGRGYNDTVPTLHRTDGYDGSVFWDPTIIFWPIENEEQNTRVFQCWNRFDVDHYAFILTDGYRQRTKDILTTDLSGSDATNLNFPPYDFSGYHRTDPVLLLNGTCVGSYIGGQQFCADGYNGVGMMLRGLSVQDQNLQRQEVLLSLDGEPCVLIRRQWTGITCNCMLPNNEYPQNRCRFCYGTGQVVGWIEFFYNRRSDGRIMVRFDPSVDDLLATDSGLESDMRPTCWTTGDVSVRDRDILVRFQPDEINEEFRYEILNVTRNRLLLAQSGVQKFAVQRVRKTDSIYQIPVFLDSSLFPRTINTSVNSSLGIPPHSHTLVVSEKILSVSQINQITSIEAGHSHTILGGVVLTEGLHQHTIIFP